MTIESQIFRDFSVSNSRPTSNFKAVMTDLETRMSKNIFIFEISMIDSAHAPKLTVRHWNM